MGSKNANPFDITEVIVKELSDYSKEIEEEVNNTAEETSKELVKDLKKTSPRRKKNGGKYAKGWTKRKEGNGYRIYNKKYQLTHLLEHGHAKANGGRVEGIPHIGPAEKKANKKFLDEIEKVIRG